MLSGSSPITDPRLLHKHTRSQGPSLRWHYPASAVLRPCPTPAGTIVETMSEARPPSHAGLPQLPGSPSRHAVPTTPMDRNGCVCRLLPRSTRAFPVTQAGSASTTSLSRPAQASLTLRPAGSLNRPRRPLSRGFGPPGCPDKPLVRYQVLPTTSWVDPSSTGEPRRWGALRNPG